jgi:lipoprotein-releasing system permease protein
MKENIKLAWRNLWRNKRRTFITVASILFAVFFASIMRSMQEGSYTSMVNNVVKFYSGYIQVHQKGYWDNRSLNRSFQENDTLMNVLENTEGVELYMNRLESGVLASNTDKNHTKVAQIVGIEPQKEDQVTKISDKIVKGDFLIDGDNDIVIAAGLAKYLELGVGDTLTLYGSGYHGTTAAGIYHIKGIIDHPSPDFNRMFVYMDIEQARALFRAYGLSTATVVMLENNDDLNIVKKKIDDKLGNHLEVMTWEEMQPVLVNQIESDRGSGIIFIFILYLVIGFGILGTVMMMMSERSKEFGVVIAVGMQRGKLAFIVFIETLLIGIIGVIVGFAVTIPINYFLYLNPIPMTGQTKEAMEMWGFEPVMYFTNKVSVFMEQPLIVFIVTIVISFYTIYNIYKLKVMEAIRG